MIEEDKYNNLISLIDLVRGFKAQKLSSWENDFMDSISERVEEYGHDVFMSDKQWLIIEKIERKLGIG